MENFFPVVDKESLRDIINNIGCGPWLPSRSGWEVPIADDPMLLTEALKKLTKWWPKNFLPED